MLLIPVAIAAAFPTVLIMIGLLEKRPAKSLVPADAGEQLALTPHMQVVNEQASR